MKFYSGISVNPKHWSKKGKFVLSVDSNSVALNTNLKALKSKVLDAYLKAKMDGTKVTSDYLKSEVWPEQSEKVNFWDVWDVYLDSKKGEFKKHTFTKFNALTSHLKKFEEFVRKPLDFDTLNKATLGDLQSFFFNEQGLVTQSTDKYIGIFKMFYPGLLSENT